MATMIIGSKGEAFELEGQTWICKNELPSDIIINIGEISFHLHKFPLLSRSEVLQTMINEFKSEDGKSNCLLDLSDLPGGPKAFELVAKFCYDIKFEVNTSTIVPLRCASEHLKMTESCIEENLIKQTETFLTEVFENNWKESLKILESCEQFLPHSEDLHIIARCIDSLASKACADPTIFGWPSSMTNSESSTGRIMWNGINAIGEKPRSPKADWWFEDISCLSLPLYKRFISVIKEKGMKPEIISGSLRSYCMKHVPVFMTLQANAISVQSENEQRGIVQEAVDMLPSEKGVNSTRFLVCLLRSAMILHASPSCWENLEKKVGAQLDEATLEDVLIPNLGYTVETMYDVDCFLRIVENFISLNQSGNGGMYSPGIVDEEQFLSSGTQLVAPMSMVAKLVDSYLGEVASDVNLKMTKFQALAAAVPSSARQTDDGIYRAIDIYLKSHPWLSDSDREQLCQLMNCQKFSLEACTHAAQNERLPLRVIVQVLFFEQLRLRTSIAGWFFVSENMDNPRAGPNTNIMLSKANTDNVSITRVVEHEGEDHKMVVGGNDEEVRARISQLEKECKSLKRDLEKLGKSKGLWSRFCSKFQVKPRKPYLAKQVFTEC